MSDLNTSTEHANRLQDEINNPRVMVGSPDGDHWRDMARQHLDCAQAYLDKVREYMKEVEK